MLAIRAAKPEELPQVRSFYHTLIDEMRDLPHRPTWEKGVYPSEGFLKRSLEQGELYVGVLEGRFVSSMVVNHACAKGYEKVQWGVDAPPEQVMAVHILGVSPKYQGRGISKQMVEKAFATARAQGARALRLDVLPTNLVAQRLYPSMGFQFKGRADLSYEDADVSGFLLYEYLL